MGWRDCGDCFTIPNWSMWNIRLRLFQLHYFQTNQKINFSPQQDRSTERTVSIFAFPRLQPSSQPKAIFSSKRHTKKMIVFRLFRRATLFSPVMSISDLLLFSNNIPSGMHVLFGFQSEPFPMRLFTRIRLSQNDVNSKKTVVQVLLSLWLFLDREASAHFSTHPIRK